LSGVEHVVPCTNQCSHSARYRPDKIKSLGVKEHERAKELQLQGKWLHLWRVAGKWSNISVFEVESPAELHDILNSLPLYPYMDVELTALCQHPGAILSSK
jgi:muconolactone D-isomerase